jgi:hypothetical protein
MALANAEVEEGYYRFVAILTWPPQADLVAAQKLKIVLQAPQGIDAVNTQTYYLTGERTFVIIGFTPSAIDLQKFISSIIFGTDLDAKVYHAVEGAQMNQCLPKTP